MNYIQRRNLIQKDLEAFLKSREFGGPGSGNFDHAGRPGEVGGSSSDGGIVATRSGKTTGKIATELFEKMKDDSNAILKLNISKSEKIKKLKEIGIFVDSSVKSGDLADRVSTIVHTIYTPRFRGSDDPNR